LLDVSLIEKHPPVPAKQPAYRQNRSHGNFLTNLNLPPHKVKEALKQSWSAGEEFKLPILAQFCNSGVTEFWQFWQFWGQILGSQILGSGLAGLLPKRHLKRERQILSHSAAVTSA